MVGTDIVPRQCSLQSPETQQWYACRLIIDYGLISGRYCKCLWWLHCFITDVVCCVSSSARVTSADDTNSSAGCIDGSSTSLQRWQFHHCLKNKYQVNIKHVPSFIGARAHTHARTYTCSVASVHILRVDGEHLRWPLVSHSIMFFLALVDVDKILLAVNFSQQFLKSNVAVVVCFQSV